MTIKRTAARIATDSQGRLRALVADGEDTTEPGVLAFLDVQEGQEPLTREQIATALAELSADALAAVIDAAVAEGQAIGSSDDPITPEVLARINALADTREEAEARQSAIETEAAEAQEQAAAALARLTGTSAEGEGDGDAEGGSEGDGDGTDADAEGADSSAAPVPVTASGTRRTRQTTALPRPGQRTGTPAARTAPRGNQAPAWTPPSAQVALVAAAGLESIGLSSGSNVETTQQLGEAINAKRHAIRNTSGGNGEQITVASVRTTYPEDRYLSENDPDRNTRNLAAATAPETLVASAELARSRGNIVAAGGLCAPITQLYDVPVIGSAARPVRDALTGMGADRGGIRWRQHLSFGDFAGATGVWTLDNDAAVTGNPATEPATKPCLDVECPSDAEAYVEAITLCMTFSNVTARFDAEATAANVQAAGVAHARYAENRLLNQIAALSTTLTAPAVISATRDILLALDRLFAAHRNFYRLDSNQAFRTVLPRWVLDALRADLLLGAGFATGDDLLDGYAVTDAQIMNWFTQRNVNATFHLDGRAATVQAGVAPALTEVTMANQFYAAWTDNGAVPNFPAQLEALMWVEGEMIHLDGGTMDLGVVRDSTLNQVNRYKQFSETFEGVAHRGVEAIRLVADLEISGMTAGTADTKALLAA